MSSTDQDPQLQLDELRQLASQRGWEIWGEFVDHGISGAADRRPELDRMLTETRKGKVDIVLVWRLDRLGRSLRHLVTLLEELRVRNVDFVSMHDPFDTSTPAGRLSLAIIGAMAEFERELIRERTRAGLAAARRRGAKLGRPRVEVNVEEALRLRADGMAMKQVAAKLGCGVTTLRRALRKHHESGATKNPWATRAGVRPESLTIRSLT